MCGFVGFTGEYDNREDIVKAMMQRIVHRGPDMGDFKLFDEVALGFRRLSILDLSTNGAQPMSNEDHTVCITFNGEIYNFQEIRAELEERGYEFHCDADTESLLHAYEEWGEDVVHHLRGMYAFVIYDAKKQRLFGARDIFGIKPFYYYQTKSGNLLFASEIKCFLEHPDFIKAVNKKALRPYMTLQFSATQETFFEGVYKLPQACSFTFDLRTRQMHVNRFWQCDFSHTGNGSFNDYVRECETVVKESVAAHRIADVKVGSFLSGGVDSSYIAAELMPDKTFSVGFAYNNFNETNLAAELSDMLGISNHRRIIDAEECFAALSDIQYHMDEPQANLSSVPLYFLAQSAAEHVTVVLSGEGADELFAGYAWYEDAPEIASYKRHVPFGVRRALGRLAWRMPSFKGRNFLLKGAEMPEHYFVGQALVFPDHELDEVLTKEYACGTSAADLASQFYAQVANEDELSKKQYLDMNMWLPGDILLKADKMCMAHSLELRVPFLDKEVMEFAQSIPARFRVNENGSKQVLRRAAEHVLPDAWAKRKKVGFPVPFIYWFREQKYYDFAKAYFNSSFASEFFNTTVLMRLLDDHFVGKANNQRKIYVALTFLIWYKRFFIDEDKALH